jgi:hypothetical protein
LLSNALMTRFPCSSRSSPRVDLDVRAWCTSGKRKPSVPRAKVPPDFVRAALRPR